jgi:hypothetical protein
MLFPFYKIYKKIVYPVCAAKNKSKRLLEIGFLGKY